MQQEKPLITALLNPKFISIKNIHQRMFLLQPGTEAETNHQGKLLTGISRLALLLFSHSPVPLVINGAVHRDGALLKQLAI